MSTTRINQTLFGDNTILQLTCSSGSSIQDYIDTAQSVCGVVFENITANCPNPFPLMQEYVSRCGTALQTFACGVTGNVSLSEIDCSNNAWAQQTADACPPEAKGLATETIVVIAIAGLLCCCSAAAVARKFYSRNRGDNPPPGPAPQPAAVQLQEMSVPTATSRP